MFDLYAQVAFLLHCVSMQIVDLLKSKFLFSFCPSWAPTILALPLPDVQPKSWMEQLFSAFFQKSWTSYILNIFSIKSLPLSQTIRNDLNITTDANFCNWLSAYNNKFSIEMQMYFFVQMILVCLLLSPLVFLLQKAGQEFSNKFRQLRIDSQQYIVLHLLKSFVFICMVCSPSWRREIFKLIDGVFSDHLTTYNHSFTMSIIQAAAFCAAVEFLIVVMVSHTSVLRNVFELITIFLLSGVNFQVFEPARMLFIYGSLSTFTFIVDMFYALRQTVHDLSKPPGKLIKFAAALTFFVCVTVCWLNWAIQSYWFWKKITFVMETNDYTHFYWPLAYLGVVVILTIIDFRISIWLWRFAMQKPVEVKVPSLSPLNQVIEGMAEIQNN